MESNKAIVMCLKCNHTFFTKVTRPRCSKCGSNKIKRAEDVPKIYGGKEIQRLKIDFEKHKEYTLEVFNLMLNRIKALEDKK